MKYIALKLFYCYSKYLMHNQFLSRRHASRENMFNFFELICFSNGVLFSSPDGILIFLPQA